MKLFLSIDEARKILADHLRSKGFHVKDEDVTEKRKTEGEYEDAIEVVTGFEVEVFASPESAGSNDGGPWPRPDPDMAGLCPRCETRRVATSRGLCRTCSGDGE